MPIITISRGTHSGGSRLAEVLAERLGYGLVSREVLAQAAASHGVSEAKLAQAIETPPGFWDRFRNERQRYLVLAQAALLCAVRRDDVVYHGHAGHLLLKGLDNLLRVRIVAPIEVRQAAVVEATGMSPEEAARFIFRQDEARIRWTRFLYNVDWADPLLYDLVINIEKVGLGDACGLIESLVRTPRFQTRPEHTKALADLCLATSVRAALAISPRTQIVDVEVTADGSAVTLKGRVPSAEVGRSAVEVARGVEGVASVEASELGDWSVPD